MVDAGERSSNEIRAESEGALMAKRVAKRETSAEPGGYKEFRCNGFTVMVPRSVLKALGKKRRAPIQGGRSSFRSSTRKDFRRSNSRADERQIAPGSERDGELAREKAEKDGLPPKE
jgi:hypothetical protein